MDLRLPNPNKPYINIITMDKEVATMDKQSTEALIEDLKIGGMDCVCKRKVRKISPKNRRNETNSVGIQKSDDDANKKLSKASYLTQMASWAGYSPQLETDEEKYAKYDAQGGRKKTYKRKKSRKGKRKSSKKFV